MASGPTWTARPASCAASRHSAWTRFPTAIRRSWALVSWKRRMVARAATGPIRSLQKVLLTKDCWAASMTSSRPMRQAMAGSDWVQGRTGDGVAIAQTLAEGTEIGLDPLQQMGSSEIETKAGGDFVEDGHRSDPVSEADHPGKESGVRRFGSSGLADDRRESITH